MTNDEQPKWIMEPYWYKYWQISEEARQEFTSSELRWIYRKPVMLGSDQQPWIVDEDVWDAIPIERMEQLRYRQFGLASESEVKAYKASLFEYLTDCEGWFDEIKKLELELYIEIPRIGENLRKTLWEEAEALFRIKFN